MSQLDAPHAPRVRTRVVVVGAGFAGLEVVRGLADSSFEVTVVDRQNHHLFQPLLFHVATGILDPAQIASPIRTLVRQQRNVRVVLGEVTEIRPATQEVVLDGGQALSFDYLVVATGTTTSYFGRDAEWRPYANGLKTLDEAQRVRNRLLSTLESAERSPDAPLPNVVIVGGGPTGVAIAGSIAELLRDTVPNEFRMFDPTKIHIVLIEAGDRLLAAFPTSQGAYAAAALKEADVEVRTGTVVEGVTEGGVTLAGGERIAAAVILWCAGVRGDSVVETLEQPLDKGGRPTVDGHFRLAEQPNCFVVGDAARFVMPDGANLPALAGLAASGGRHVARVIAAQVHGRQLPPAFDAGPIGNVATITRRRGVAEVRGFRITGLLAWLAWGLLHLRSLADGSARRSVFISWIRLITRYKRSARIIVRGPE